MAASRIRPRLSFRYEAITPIVSRAPGRPAHHYPGDDREDHRADAGQATPPHLVAFTHENHLLRCAESVSPPFIAPETGFHGRKS